MIAQHTVARGSHQEGDTRRSLILFKKDSKAAKDHRPALTKLGP